MSGIAKNMRDEFERLGGTSGIGIGIWSVTFEEWVKDAERLQRDRDSLLAACKDLLAYHVWAKHGDISDEPDDPEEAVKAAIAQAESDQPSDGREAT